MGRSKNCDPVTRNNTQKLYGAGHSYRNVAELLWVWKTMVENAVKWVAKQETHGRKPEITHNTKRNIVQCVKKIHSKKTTSAWD